LEKFSLKHLFFSVIITGILFAVNGCGYKADPYYEKKSSLGDENVEFYMQQKQQQDTENEQRCK